MVFYYVETPHVVLFLKHTSGTLIFQALQGEGGSDGEESEVPVK